MVQRVLRTVPLTSDNLSIAKVATDPTPAFRQKNCCRSPKVDPLFAVYPYPRQLGSDDKGVAGIVLRDSLNLESDCPILSVAMAKEMDRIGFD